MSVSNRKLLQELHDVIDLFRTIFDDDKKLVSGIDEAYEQTLMQELALVPEQFDTTIIQYIGIVKVMANNIDFKTLASNLEDMKAQGELPIFEINTFEVVKLGFKNLGLAKGNFLRVCNMLTKLGPIFKCVDKVMTMPIHILKRIGEITENGKKYDDLI